MTDRRDFDDGAPGPDGLEAFFAAARGDAAQPDGALLSRIEADALAALPRPARTKRRGAGWRALVQGLGGWPAVAGLAAATCAGLWLGVSPPAALDAVWPTDPALTSVDPLGGYDLAMLGG